MHLVLPLQFQEQRVSLLHPFPPSELQHQGFQNLLSVAVLAGTPETPFLHACIRRGIVFVPQRSRATFSYQFPSGKGIDTSGKAECPYETRLPPYTKPTMVGCSLRGDNLVLILENHDAMLGIACDIKKYPEKEDGFYGIHALVRYKVGAAENATLLLEGLRFYHKQCAPGRLAPGLMLAQKP